MTCKSSERGPQSNLSFAQREQIGRLSSKPRQRASNLSNIDLADAYRISGDGLGMWSSLWSEDDQPSLESKRLECGKHFLVIEAYDVGSLGKSHSKLNFDVLDRLTSWSCDTYLCALHTRSRTYTKKRTVIGCDCSFGAVLFRLTKITGAAEQF